MSASTIVLAILGLLAVALILWAVRTRGAPTPARVGRTALTVDATGVATVALEVEEADPGSPVVRRLVHEAAARVFAMLPDAEEVEVRSRTGVVIGRVSRKAGPPAGISVSPLLYEPRTRRAHGPDLSGHLREDELPPAPTPRVETAPRPAPPRWTALERFDFPETVRARVRDPDDPTDLVRAILEAGGIPHRVDGDLVLAGGVAVVVVRPDGGVVVGHGALNHAYLRVVGSGARRGLVIAMGLVDPREIKHREMAAPQVLHAGPDAIQRMADAVSLGADPLRFAVAIPMTAPR